MSTFNLEQLIAQQRASGRLYLEFFRRPSLSLGVYVLPVGTADPQEPHSEDEVYFVHSGRAQIRINEEDFDVEPGSIIFVAKETPHRFHSIIEDLKVLVFFAPAETS
ncbi:MAG: cupin domain-containing protein [Anaerolineales bacterium]|nr:cupin domain-containing protein [Anaerolineales bacterium]